MCGKVIANECQSYPLLYENKSYYGFKECYLLFNHKDNQIEATQWGNFLFMWSYLLFNINPNHLSVRSWCILSDAIIETLLVIGDGGGGGMGGGNPTRLIKGNVVIIRLPLTHTSSNTLPYVPLLFLQEEDMQ